MFLLRVPAVKKIPMKHRRESHFNLDSVNSLIVPGGAVWCNVVKARDSGVIMTVVYRVWARGVVLKKKWGRLKQDLDKDF